MHPDSTPVPEDEQLAALLWKCEHSAGNRLSGGDGIGDGSVSWWTLQPIERQLYKMMAENLEASDWYFQLTKGK